MTAWAPRDTHCRPEVEERLCQLCRVRCGLCHLIDRYVDPLGDPGDIDIRWNDMCSERERPQGVRGVGADSRQLPQSRRRRRPARRCDGGTGALEVDGAAVVAQPGPRSDHIGGRRRGQRRRRRPTLQPDGVAGDDAGDLRLLEHHLGDEDRVRVARPAPRQVAAVCAVPARQGGYEPVRRWP